MKHLTKALLVGATALSFLGCSIEKLFLPECNRVKTIESVSEGSRSVIVEDPVKVYKLDRIYDINFDGVSFQRRNDEEPESYGINPDFGKLKFRNNENESCYILKNKVYNRLK